MGGRSSDSAGSEFTHPFEYDPVANSWTTKSATYPDNQVNNMACGVLTEAATPYIYCVGGSAATQTTATARVFRYNPLTDTINTLTAPDNWPGDAGGTILPGGFALVSNKLYILGGFNINVASTNQTWQFDPTAAVGSKWLQRVNTPVGIMFAPACSIGGIIYVAGASDFSGGLVIDTTNSFSFNPATNTVGAIAAIPRATGETRALNFNGQMWVMGGGRVAPNPSNEVDIYDTGTNTWSTGAPFGTRRRNFATDTNGSDRIWLAGGYASDSVTALSSMEIFDGTCVPVPTPTPTPTVTPACSTVTRLSQNFDGVTPPTLPVGWTATNASGPAPLWTTSNSGVLTPVADTAPNAAFVDDPAVVSDKRLDSPSIAIQTAGAQLTFRQNRSLEGAPDPALGSDGGVLEISIGGGAFADILTAGGSFVTDGYNTTINSNFANPLAGRRAWTGTTPGGFVTTTVNLPPAAAGKNIVLRWRMGSDSSFSSSGWRIDTITVTECVPAATTPTNTPTSTPTNSPTNSPLASFTSTPAQFTPTPGVVVPTLSEPALLGLGLLLALLGYALVRRGQG